MFRKFVYVVYHWISSAEVVSRNTADLHSLNELVVNFMEVLNSK